MRISVKVDKFAQKNKKKVKKSLVKCKTRFVDARWRQIRRRKKEEERVYDVFCCVEIKQTYIHPH